MSTGSAAPPPSRRRTAALRRQPAEMVVRGETVNDAPERIEAERRRGRGATINPTGRFEPAARSDFHDGWDLPEDLPPFATRVIAEQARTIITRNDSPDIGFDRSANPYRGCEHGCVYCFARPTHAYQGLSWP